MTISESKYDVERDMRIHAAERARNLEAGLEKTDTETRAAGGIPLSNRAAVLLHHYGKSYVDALSPGTDAQREAALFDAVSCSRRIIEYIGALEDATLLHFTEDPGDTVKETIGLAAATIEKLCDDIDAHWVNSGEAPDENATRGLGTFRAVVQRLRLIEEAITRIPGYAGDASTLVLPVVS